MSKQAQQHLHHGDVGRNADHNNCHYHRHHGEQRLRKQNGRDDGDKNEGWQKEGEGHDEEEEEEEEEEDRWVDRSSFIIDNNNNFYNNNYTTTTTTKRYHNTATTPRNVQGRSSKARRRVSIITMKSRIPQVQNLVPSTILFSITTQCNGCYTRGICTVHLVHPPQPARENRQAVNQSDGVAVVGVKQCSDSGRFASSVFMTNNAMMQRWTDRW